MDDKNEKRRMPPRATHFDQVPLALVRKIAQADEPTDRTEGIVLKVEPYSMPPERLKKSRQQK